MKPTLHGKKTILHYVVTKRIFFANYIGYQKNFIRSIKFGEKNKIIQEQINEDIIENVNETETPEKGKEFYLLYRPVIRESAETTKIRIYYDASAKPNKDSVSLNEFLETSLPLQNSLQDILIKSVFNPSHGVEITKSLPTD